MNFKKSKDVKRSSYYVWFLGSKESKGLRGDEYVTPVLNYLLDSGECSDAGLPPLEPSKVTLQVSSKGLKIIQILSVPRKSCQKLSADQQSQLFANSRLLKQSHLEQTSSASAASSMLKSEQVKHHIPHNSITWVYQEEDIVCAILLLYNPLTRCPVHVHAYRCDSVETADSLRAQLQVLVNRPENQKKFRDIESRLRAKGLLLPPLPNSSDYNYAEEELTPIPGPNSFVDETMLQSCYDRSGGNGIAANQSKTLKSDGRSTRTEGSDELNSEESNSSDLGYAVRFSKNDRHHSVHHNNYNHSNPMMMMISPLPQPMSMHQHHCDQSGGSKGKKKQHSSQQQQQQHLLPPSVAHFKQQQHNSNKQKKQNRQSKSKRLVDEEAEDLPATAALYDSLAAELRAKLGNPKVGPLLLPPRDYDASTNNGENKENNSKHKQMFPLSRSESSGKSSSGIGSEETLSNENQQPKNSSRYYCRDDHHYVDDIDCHEQPQSFIIDFDHDHQNYRHHKQRASNSYLFGGGKLEKPQLYSLPINSYSSEEEDEDEDDKEDFDHDHHLEVDAEDIEEDVLFTANYNRKSKSSFDLFPQQYKSLHSQENALHNKRNNFTETSKYCRQQRLSYPSPLEMDHLQFERKSRSRHQPQPQQQREKQQQKSKMYSSNPNLSRNPLKEVSKQQTSDKSAFVVGRREQRTLQQHGQQHQLISGDSPPVGKFSFGAMPSSTSTAENGNSHRQRIHQQHQSPSSKPPPKFYFADAEFGDSKTVPHFSTPLDSFVVSGGGDKSKSGKNGQSPRQHLGRSSGNLACLDYNSGPTSLAYNYSHQQYSAEAGRRSPGQFRPPRQETRYEMLPPSSQLAPVAPVSFSKLCTQYGQPVPVFSAYPKSSRGQQFVEHGYDHELAMRKKLEQPYSRYSYIDVDHSRAERFHYVPPTAAALKR